MPSVARVQLDYYSVLEITPAADAAEINAAFRRLAWRYHPDRNPAPGATLQFQDINEAHQVLSDPARRAEYDAKWHPRINEHQHHVRHTQRHRPRRWWRRHRHARAVILTMCVMVFVSTAWAAIFTALTAAHSAGSGYLLDSARTAMAGGSGSCGYSMEIIPMNYVDDHGRTETGWVTKVSNCYGGSAQVSNLPAASQPRAFGTWDDLQFR